MSKETKETASAKRLVAKRDFIIHQNEVHIEIKEGDDIGDVPQKFHQNLKTEKVI